MGALSSPRSILATCCAPSTSKFRLFFVDGSEFLDVFFEDSKLFLASTTLPFKIAKPIILEDD